VPTAVGRRLRPEWTRSPIARLRYVGTTRRWTHRRCWPEREELRREVFDYIEIFYNATRRHSTLGMLSPARYEDEMISLKQLKNDFNN